VESGGLHQLQRRSWNEVRLLDLSKATAVSRVTLNFYVRLICSLDSAESQLKFSLAEAGD
jgi:hypothetical protein